MHVPVMLGECLEFLAPRPEGIYLDATAGLGGHTAAIAARLTTGFVIANDRDAESLELAKRNTAQWTDRIRYHPGSFGNLGAALRALGVEQVDGLLADLGVSRYQLMEPERGFSLMADGPLDMRQDRSQELTADEIVNFTPEKELADLIYRLREERTARWMRRRIRSTPPQHS